MNKMHVKRGDTVKVIGTCIIEICTLFGVLNNPTDREGF